MTPEGKELLKSMGKLIGYFAADLADAVTLGIPRAIYENHIDKQVQKKIIEIQSPLFSRLEIGVSEHKVRMLLGLPLKLEIQKKQDDNWEYKFDKYWKYDGGVVYFKNKKVVAFWYKSALNKDVEKGFPIQK